MWGYIPERVKMEAEYILQTGATVRACAAHFDVSKSTVHKDVTERLKDIDEKLWEGVRTVLDKNLSERHIRGGIATKKKYLGTEKAALSRCDSVGGSGGNSRSLSGGNCCCSEGKKLGCERKECISCGVCSKKNPKNLWHGTDARQ